MKKTKPANARKPHIVFYFSDTGGGHRSAAEAIIEAVHLEYKNKVTTEMVDFFKDYAPPPFNRAAQIYSYMVKAPHLWELSYKITDGRLRARAFTASMWPYVGRAVNSLVKSHPADMIVTVHPIAAAAIIKVLGYQRPPFVTLVTDWISNHALWYDKRSDLIIVPTEMAREGAIRYGMNHEKVIVAGFPVVSRHSAPLNDKIYLRRRLGWPLGKMIVLLVGGGEGMGPLQRTMNAINNSGLNLGLIVITGRNEKLMKKLECLSWNMETIIYGFTREMPEFMRAADTIITKAGAATIAESLNAGLPMIFHSRVPGQEDGNVEFVTSSGAGFWVPTPEAVVDVLIRWNKKPGELLNIATICHSIARPDAARTIACLLGEKINL